MFEDALPHQPLGQQQAEQGEEIPEPLEMQVARMHRDTAPQGSAHGCDMRDPMFIAENFSHALEEMENAEIKKLYTADDQSQYPRLRMRVTALSWYLEEQDIATRKWGYVSSAKTNVTYPKGNFGQEEKKIPRISGFFHKDMKKDNSGNLSNGVPAGSYQRR